MITLMRVKQSIGLIGGTIASLAFVPQAFAQAPSDPNSICPQDSVFFKLCTQVGGLSLGNIVGKVISLLLVVAVVVALIFLVWGGIKWIMSGGDKAGVEGARNQIIAAVVGLIVAFAAYIILNFVLGLFGLGAANAIVLPTLIPNP